MRQANFGLNPLLKESRLELATSTVPREFPKLKTNPSAPNLLPHQIAAVQVMLEDALKGGSLLADDMGLGKSAIAITLINTIHPSGDVMIVCPASLIANWEREWEMWGVPSMRRPIITNYEKLKKLSEEASYSIIIFDESHYLKNPEAQRTQKAMQLKARARFFLTGTPIMNRPIEIYTALHSLRPNIFKNYKDYAERYCEGRWIEGEYDVSGASRLPELNSLLRKTCLIRRTKKQCLKNLPPKHYKVVNIDPPASIKPRLQRAMDVLDEYRLKMSEIYRQIERGNSAETTGALYGKLNNIRRYIGRKLEPTRILTAQAKLKTAIRKARILVKHGEQVAVYCIHQDIQRALREAFSEKGIPMSIVNQKVTKKKRDEAVQDFQSGKSKIFLATIGTAGTGITLSAARHLIFVEIDWTPGAMSQTEDRIWRIGQEREPTIHYLVLRCSTDKKMLETIRRKQEHADSAIDGILTD